MARQKIRHLGGHQPLIAKIEKPQAVAALEAIVAEADGLMVARGDLGVELSVDQVPIVQKRLIRLANRAGKPVITATQMLESMITNPRPTRAEASDIANAILDGSDAVMLSGETAVGAHPVLTVRTMALIARTIERDPSWRIAMDAIVAETVPGDDASDAWAVANAAGGLASSLRVSSIAVVTGTGGTAKRVSQRRPGVPILALADDPQVAAWLSLWHGVDPLHRPIAIRTDALMKQVDDELKRLGIAQSGERVISVGSAPRARGMRAYFIEYHDLP
jgi:pyruvate kinase